MSLQRLINAPWLRPIILIAILIVLWDLIIRVFQIPQYLIPTPLEVLEQLWLEWPMLLSESLVTTYAR